MALRLYVLQGCPFGHRVAIAIAEKNLPVEIVSFERGKRPPELEALSPRAKSPTLFDGDAKVYESLAVLEYLEDRYPQPALLPNDAFARAEARMFIARVTEEMAPRVGAVIAESTNPAQDGKKLATHLQGLLEHLATWDRHFAMRPFAVGDAPTIADIVLYPFFPVLRRVAGVKIGGDLPHLRGWLERMQARPSTALPTALAPTSQREATADGPIAGRMQPHGVRFGVPRAARPLSTNKERRKRCSGSSLREAGKMIRKGIVPSSSGASRTTRSWRRAIASANRRGQVRSTSTDESSSAATRKLGVFSTTCRR